MFKLVHMASSTYWIPSCRAAHGFNHKIGVPRHLVAPPGDVSIRSHEDEPASVELLDVRLDDRDRLERHASFGCRAFKRGDFGCVHTEAQQHKTAPEKVEDRAAVAEPGVRRARAGTRRGHEDF